MSRFVRRKRRSIWVMGGGCFYGGLGAAMATQPLIAVAVLALGMMLLLAADYVAGTTGTDSRPAKVRRARP